MVNKTKYVRDYICTRTFCLLLEIVVKKCGPIKFTPPLLMS